MDAEFSDIRARALNSGNQHLVKAGRLAFRNIFDPYCAEWSGAAERLVTISSLGEINVELPVLVNAYKKAFADRPDIVDACADGLADTLANAVKVIV